MRSLLYAHDMDHCSTKKCRDREVLWKFVYDEAMKEKAVGMQACGDVMIGQHGCTGDQCMKLSRIFVGQRRFPLLFFFYHHLEIINQSIKPTVERLSYILHDSFISRDPHLLTKAGAAGPLGL